MVFESLVVDLVNRYLGDFIENLDKSQLKIGIWGGDVVLNNLFVKDSALDALDLPVKVIQGNLGKLTLKIPWKNLYTEPVVANLDGLYIVAVPNAGVKFNKEKEEKAEQDAKQKELARIEEAKKQEAEKHKTKQPQSDSFAEKMATQVIKNLQVTVSNIHVRYEDHMTNPQRPFAIGVSLKGLSFQTTDEYWKPTIIKDTVDKIFKLVKLESLSVYWNSSTASYLKMDRETLLATLKKNIMSPGTLTDYQYLLEPVSSSAQLRLHTKPEKDEFSIPKVLLNVVLEEIAVGLSRSQYLDVMELLESFERLALTSKYRKYGRPDVPHKGNAKQWWHFAYRSILEERVRRRRKMWSWDHIHRHRVMCKEYKAAYKKKLTNKKIPTDVQQTLERLEKELSVFNITLVRQAAEVEVKKEGAKKAKGDGGGGWFSGWWGGSKKKEEAKEPDITDQFEQAMTEAEKNKLYEAIGYQENAVDPTLPKEFVANKLHFQLHNLSLSLRDPMAASRGQVVKLELKEVSAAVGQRPAAAAVKVDARMDRLQVLGVPTGGAVPVLVNSISTSSHVALLSTTFETNPLDGLCDQRVKLNSQPLEIVYDATTINQVADFFKPPESVHLKQLQAAAMMKFEDIKEQTASGLQHTIEQHKYTDINVDLQPCHVIIPDQGNFRKDARVLVVDLGNLRVMSEKQVTSPSSPKSSEALSFDDVMKKAYDKFKINLSSVQLLYAGPGEDWKSARKMQMSPMHVLRPLTLKVDLEKSILQDPKIPKMRVSGELPQLAVSISDARLQELLSLVQSIPFPESPPAPPEEVIDSDEIDVSAVAMEGDADALLRKIPVPRSDSSDDEFYEDSTSGLSKDAAETLPSKSKLLKTQTSQEYVNAIDMQLNFELKEINLQLAQRRSSGEEVPIMKIVIDSLGTGVTMRTFDMSASAYLGGIYIQHCEFKATEAIQAWLSQGKALAGGPLINLVNTPGGDGSTKLLMVDYLKANKKGPEFASKYKNTEQKISVHFTSLEVLLHQEALLSIMAFAQKIIPPPAPAKEETAVVETQKPAAAPAVPAVSTATQEAAEQARQRRRDRLQKAEPEVVDIAVEAKLDVLAVAVCNQQQLITDIRIQGLDARVNVLKARTTVAASLRDICVFDPTPHALYPKILSIEGQEVFNVDIGVFNGATSGDNYSNMDAVDTSVKFDSGCMKIVFLNKFVTSLLTFLDQFQAAKDKISEASSAVAETAVVAAQEFSAKAPRIKLDIRLKAPIIIVPQKSTSVNALVIDLGNLTLANRFQVTEGRSSDGTPAVLDHMKIELAAVKISRSMMSDMAVSAECLILEPVNIQLNLSRNLSAAWYHGHPDIDISGQLDAFQASLSQGDFAMLMATLNENLTEGTTSPPPKPQLPALPEKEGAVAADATGITQAAAPSATGAEPAVKKETAAVVQAISPTAVVYIKMKFSFTIKTINATLYNGDSNLLSGFSPREERQSLGRFELKLIAVNGAMKSDTAMDAKVMLQKCVLEDTRPGMDKGITRMVQNAAHTDVKHANMIDVTFTQNAHQSKDMNVCVNGLHICVCPEYLMAIADFFVKGLPSAPPSQPTPAGQVQPSAQPQQAAPAEPPAGDMTMTLTVVQPEIVMVEDAMRFESNALILNTHVFFKMRMTPEQQSIMGTIKGLQVISCIYAEDKRDKTKQLILAPTDISLNTSAPQGKNMHVDIIVTDIEMNISPATIRCVTATLSSFSTKTDEEEGSSRAPVPQDLWLVKKIDDCDFWFLKMAGEQVDPGQVLDILDEEIVESRGEQLMMSVNQITVKLEGGVGKRTVPLLVTQMTFRAEVRDWSSKLYVSSDLSMEVNYYNEHLAVWEPLIEPVEDMEKKQHRPWELNLEVQKNDLFSLDDEEPDSVRLPPPKMTVNLKSTDILQTTITKTCMEVLGNLGKAFGDAYNLVEVSEGAGEAVAPYIIQNDSGLMITVKLDDTFKMPAQAANNHVGLMPSDRLPLHNTELPVSPTRRGTKSSQTEKQKSVVIILEEFGATRELSIMKAEQRAFSINQRSYPGDTWCLIADTKAKIGCKEIILRSMLQVHNHLSHGVEVYYKLGDDCKGRCGEMQMGEKLNVPLEAVYAAPYELYFRVMHADYGESKLPLMWRDLKEGSSNGIICCEPHDASKQPFYFSVKVEVENILYENTGELTAQSYTLHLYPCAVFRNLLPLPVRYTLEGVADSVTVEGGATSALLNARIGTSNIEVLIPNYQGKEWTARRLIDEKPEPLSVWTFESHEDSTRVTMDLGLHSAEDKGYQQLSLYCPYWMLNKTGRALTYKAGDDFLVNHPTEEDGVILFSFKSKSFFGVKKEEGETEPEIPKKGTLGRKSKPPQSPTSPKKKGKSKAPKKKTMKASLRVGESEWSDKFSLDTVGSTGTVSCKFKGYNYEGPTPGGFDEVGSNQSDDKITARRFTCAAVQRLTEFKLEKSMMNPIEQLLTKMMPSEYKVGVKITLASSGLTKMVVFTPYFMLFNEAPFTISCHEAVPESYWCDVPPGECVPFWPVQTSKKMQMRVKVKDKALETTPFYFTEAHTTLLPLEEYGGINVETQVTESAINIKFQQYSDGMAAGLIVNFTQTALIEYMQSPMGLTETQVPGSKLWAKFNPSLRDVPKDSIHKLQPGEVILYTWQDALGKRELLWSSGDKKDQKDDLVKDGIGEYFYNADTKIYWVSFLDGMQRVLLFTEDLALATMAQQAGELEQVDQEINLQLQGMGLSLVNNMQGKEIAYMAITSSGVVWEIGKKKRFKALKVKQCNAIEAAYQQYQNELAIGKKPASRKQIEKIEVDFGGDKMTMLKPSKGVIQRVFQTGIWVQYRMSPHQIQFHAKIHHLQLDNQLPGAIFPTVLAPVPPPKSVAAESVAKPFTEVSVMIRKRDFNTVLQFKYCKVLIQEMSVKVDQGFLNGLISLFASEALTEEQEAALFQEDCKIIDTALLEDASQASSSGQKNYYDILHFSPLKIHLSFSMYAGAEKSDDKKPAQLSSNVLNLFLQSVGVVLSDIQDVIFKLGYFERNYMFYNQNQLTGEITRHYSQQAIKQMYVLVLGLDVLGNPFGVIRGLAEGIEDLFYEPYQGAIQGPEEFAEGLALGVRSLFGHAVGGAAGAVSRITGALGKGIATLTLDDEYQQKRREQMSKKPADLKEGLARGGKGLVMGVVDGVTGIVMRPVEGAKQEGVEGFFKGVGKGLVGAFTRPASGVIDFASTTFEGVKRAAEMGEEVRRLRPPRFLHKDRIVRPYKHREAEGNDTLQDVEKGKYSTDMYYGHVILTKDLKNVLLVTDKRIIFASKGDIFGHWDCDWTYVWSELKEPPTLTSKGLQVLLKENEGAPKPGSGESTREGKKPKLGLGFLSAAKSKTSGRNPLRLAFGLTHISKGKTNIVDIKQEKQKKSFFSSGTVGKLVPIPDKAMGEWILTCIQEAMSKTS